MEGGGSIHTGRNPGLPSTAGATQQRPERTWKQTVWSSPSLCLPLPSLMSRLLWANAPVSVPVSLSSLQVSLLPAYLYTHKWQKKKRNSCQLLVYTTNRPTFTLKGPVVNNQTLQILLLLLQPLSSTPRL